jgi:DNA polymerase III sliding clamp (beta) subunit (PCNA family)
MAQRNAPAPALRRRRAHRLGSDARRREATSRSRSSTRGRGLEIGFNPDFLRDGLEAVTADVVQLKLINRLRPGLIAAPDESFWYLIMPIRLAG